VLSKRKLKTIGLPPSRCSTPGFAPRRARLPKSIEIPTRPESTGTKERDAKKLGVSAVEDAGLLLAEPVITVEGRVELEAWTFKVGQCVSHKDQILPSLVLDRFRTSKGKEIYGLHSFAIDDEHRDRIILGESLVKVRRGSRPCRGCLLLDTSMCPG